MAKKHQIKISKSGTRRRAERSWRRAAKRALSKPGPEPPPKLGKYALRKQARRKRRARAQTSDFKPIVTSAGFANPIPL